MLFCSRMVFFHTRWALPTGPHVMSVGSEWTHSDSLSACKVFIVPGVSREGATDKLIIPQDIIPANRHVNMNQTVFVDLIFLRFGKLLLGLFLEQILVRTRIWLIVKYDISCCIYLLWSIDYWDIFQENIGHENLKICRLDNLQMKPLQDFKIPLCRQIHSTDSSAVLPVAC